MASGLFQWLMANWGQVLLLLIAIDQVFVGIFPSSPIFGHILDILKALAGGSNPPQIKK